MDEVRVTIEDVPAAEELIDEAVEDGARMRIIRRAGQLEVWRDEVLLFGEARRREDRAFAEFATAPITGRDDLVITLAGLGTGQLLRALLDVPGVREVEVIERSAAVQRWARSHFARCSGGAAADPRVVHRTAELSALLDAPEAPSARFALVLDLDASLAAGANASLYDAGGVDRCQRVLRPGGVLAVASTRREPDFLRQLSARMQNVAEIAAPVDTEPGALDYFYRARRPAAGGPAPRGRN